MMSATTAQIACPIGIFAGYEAEQMRLTRAINLAPTVQAKAGHARDLVASTGALIACREYNEDNLDCCLCRNVSSLRRQTAMLVLKASQMQSIAPRRLPESER